MSVAPWWRACASRSSERSIGDDPLGSRESRADHGAEPDETAAEDDARRAGLDAGRVERRADPGREAARERARIASSGASGLTFASAISGITVYSANVEVPMKWRSSSPFRERRVVPSGR